MNSARDPLGLSSLAQPQPPADGWPLIEAALLRRRAARKQVSWATAAAVLVAVGMYFQLQPERRSAAPEKPLVQQATVQQPRVQSAMSPLPSAATGGNSLATLVGLSQDLESSLNRARSRVAVLPTQSLVYQVELEDLVVQVDEAINQKPDSLELWSQRVNLLLDLNQIYRKELRRDYSNVASL